MAVVLLVISITSILATYQATDVQDELDAHSEERSNLLVPTPKKIDVPDIEGYIMSVLAETEAAIYFAESEGSPQYVQKRNFHLALESGAIIGTTSVPAIYDAARNDILSGKNTYGLYAASGRELSRLLAAGLLDDLGDKPYIDTSSKWFDERITSSLSLYGKQHFLSSTVTDTYEHTSVLAYNSMICDKDELSSLAKSGKFTLERLLAYEKEGIATFDIDREDTFPLYVSVGGSFISAGVTPAVTGIAEFKAALEKVSPLAGDLIAGDEAVGFADGSSTPFAVVTLKEAKELHRANEFVGVLPLPKQSEEDEYRCYTDVGKAILLSMPIDNKDSDKVSYILYRLAYLSQGYTTPFFYSELDLDNGEMLELIKNSTVCDLSALFGYGDIDSLITDITAGDVINPTLEYYNRKTLYEKAFEIIEKRNNTENQE